MRELAQTNVQLSRQLVGLGWDDDDLLAYRRAYELAMWLFSGQYRAHGKPQLDHHVGVAGALATTGARPELVLAGLVHSAYFLGEFGTGRLAVTPEKRAEVRDAVGADVEGLVHSYTTFTWDRDAVRRLPLDTGPRAPALADVVAMRLANEADELADAVGRYCEHEEPSFDDPDGRELLDQVAVAFGLDAMRDVLRAASAQGDATPVPEVLRSSLAHSVTLPPASYRRRLHIVLQDSRLGHEVAARVPGARTLAERIRRLVR